MGRPRYLVVTFALALMTLGADGTSGQSYPNKPIRIVVSGPGNSLDFGARLIAQALSSSMGQPVIVDNRGSGHIPGEIVSKAPADGYTLLVAGGTFAIGPLLQKTPYNPVTDFSPITLAATSPLVLVVIPSVPVKSVKELVALAKARPGELNYSSAGTGSASHLAGELFKSMAGINIVRIPYKTSSLQMTDLIGGQIQLTFSPAPPVVPHIKSAKLRALAVTSAEPSTLVPGLPTVTATLPGYEAVSITGIFGPAKMPVTIINRLNEEIVRYLRTAAAKEQFFNAGVDVVGSSPQQLAGMIKADIARMSKVITEAGIKEE